MLELISQRIQNNLQQKLEEIAENAGIPNSDRWVKENLTSAIEHLVDELVNNTTMGNFIIQAYNDKDGYRYQR